MLIGAVCGGAAVLYVFYKVYVYGDLPINWDLPIHFHMDPDYIRALYGSDPGSDNSGTDNSRTDNTKYKKI